MKKIFLIVPTLLFCTSCFAGIRLANVFGDGMVLQQKASVRIWGMADPNSTVFVDASWGSKAEAGCDASGRWSVGIRTPEAGYSPQCLRIYTTADSASGVARESGKPSESLTVSDILIGEVWMCSGQSNMELIMQPYPDQHLHVDNAEAEIASAGNEYVRYNSVKRNESFSPLEDTGMNGWKKIDPESVRWVSAVGYYFASMLQKQLGVPVGLICDYYGASPIQSWIPERRAKDRFYAKENARLEEKRASGAEKPEFDMISALYDAMINPVIGYGIKGWLWYQGEANVGDEGRYLRMMEDLVESWREDWKADLPFYFVQLPPFVYPGSQSGRWAYLAESQEVAEDAIGNSAMIVTADIGNPANIHPGNKKDVGERLAAVALNKAYGKRGFKCAYPRCVSARLSGGKVEMAFRNVGKGLSSDGECSEFAVSADGENFVAAKVSFSGNKILLGAEGVAEPRFVRYCWHDSARSNVFNSFRLPLGPFRMEVK
jgi:sialate O-acetylesterase